MFPILQNKTLELFRDELEFNADGKCSDFRGVEGGGNLGIIFFNFI